MAAETQLRVASLVAVLAVAVAVGVGSAGAAAPPGAATGTAQAYRALPADDAARTAIVGQSYLYATFVDSYSDELGLPARRLHSTNRSYGYFAPPPETDDAALFVGTDPGPLRPYFRDVQEVGAVPSGGATGLSGEELSTTRIWWLTGRTAPWAQIWAERRSLTVT